MFGVFVKDCFDREYRYYKDILDVRGDKKNFILYFKLSKSGLIFVFL